MREDFIELFDYTEHGYVSKGLFRKSDIYRIVPPTKQGEWAGVELHVRTANWVTFLLMTFLAVLIVGIPWFISYCVGVYVRTTHLYISYQRYEEIFCKQNEVDAN